MSDLQVSLLVVGAAVIISMIGYNWFQDFRLRKQASERFGQGDEDPLLNTTGDRIEPGFTGGSGDGGSQLATDEIPDALLSNEVAQAPDRKLFSEFFIRFDEPQDANCWASLVNGLEQINRKKILYAVCPNRDQESAQVWFKPLPYDGVAQAMRISVQLANRKGPLSSIEFSEVLAKLRRFAEDHNGEIEFPEMKDVVARAETLDQAAAALDTLLGLHCMLPEDAPETEAIDQLKQAGWIQKGHQWHLESNEGVLATMVIHHAPGKRLLSFNIDVPNSPDPLRALGDVVTFCHGMNQKYSAALMDDSGRTLSTKAIEGIYEQLVERVRNLKDSGFAPGAAISKMLFS